MPLDLVRGEDRASARNDDGMYGFAPPRIGNAYDGALSDVWMRTIAFSTSIE